MGLDEKLFYLNLALPLWSLPRWFVRSGTQAAARADADGFVAQWHEHWPASEAFEADFERLLRSKACACAFHAPAWQSTIARPFERVGRYRLLTIRDETGLAAALPLWLRRADALESAGAMISDYLEPLIRDGSEREVWKAVLRALDDAPGTRVRELVLHNLRPEFVDLAAVQEAAALAGFDAGTGAAAAVHRVALAGNWDGFLAGLESRDRKEVRRKLRNAEARADARLVVAKEGGQVLDALQTTMAFMRRSAGRKGLKARWSYRPLFARAGSGLAKGGWLQVYLLQLRGRDAAGLICFPSAHGPLVWGAGFDEAARAWSPGIVLFAMAIRHAITESAASFDFLRGEARCKAELGAVETPLCRITLTRTA